VMLILEISQLVPVLALYSYRKKSV